uniref:Uncharacterized protein n=1 Tax=Siphoviridae sp. ctICF6 TaxID=2825427 RepID=A0A8S5ULC4_9CAUD|nr:MAG TPA: hypothetical protein [Siphoviridae sp. ctICF6]
MAVIRRLAMSHLPSMGERQTAHPPWPQMPKAFDSNKGVSEGLSALGGKSTRVRRESPSKAPKNGSQIVFCPVRPRRRNWQGVR